MRRSWSISRLYRRAAVISAICLVAHARVASAQNTPLTTPVGTWHTVSDVDGKPRGVIAIREVNGRLVGTARGSLVPGERNDRLCDKCPGERQGKPIFGMDILTGLRPDGDEWTGGEILDPDTGKVYKAKIRLIDGGRKLVLRGYIGVSLLGRSQTWVRAE